MLFRRPWSVLVSAALVAGAASGAAPAAQRSPVWHSARDISPVAPLESDLGLAVNGPGDGVVVWASDRSGKARIHSRIVAVTRKAGGRFSRPQTIFVKNAYCPGAVAGMDSAGNAVVAWACAESGWVVRVVTRRVGGSWSSPVILSRHGSSPALAINAAGDVVAAWVGGPNDNRGIEVVTRAAGGSWSPPVLLPPKGVTFVFPRVAIDGAGNAVVVWSSGPDPMAYDGIAWAASRRVGETWSDSVALSQPGVKARFPSVVSNAAGSTIVAWSRRLAASDSAVQATVRSPGTAFATATDLSAPGVVAYAPSPGLDGAGDAIVTWGEQNAQGDEQFGQATRWAGGSFSAPATFGPSTGFPRGFGSLGLAVNPAGDAVAGWDLSSFDLEMSPGRVFVARRPASGSFGEITGLSEPGIDAFDVRVAIDDTGRAIAVWQAGRRVQAVALSPTGRALPVARIIDRLHIAPAHLKAARSGPTVRSAKNRIGAVISYTLTTRATVRFKLQRAVRRRGGKPRFVKVGGSFVRHARFNGIDRFRFSGRIGGQKLSPGRYRLTATALALDHTRTTVRKSFHITP